MLKHQKDYLFNDKIILKSQQRFKSDHHNAYTEQINKIALISNDDKRLQAFDKILNLVFMSMYGLNHSSWLNWITLCTF